MSETREPATRDALPELTFAELTARIVARCEPESALAFDADGTLWSGDIGMETFEAVLARGLVRAEALAALTREAAEFSVARADEPNEQARLLYRAFEGGQYPEDRAFAMMAWALAGHSLDEVRAIAVRVVDELGLAARMLPESMAILRWATARGLPVVVVSASPELVVEAALTRLGVPVGRVFGMRAACDEGVLLAAPVGTPTYGPGKAATLVEALPTAKLVAAFGDSAFDLPMLRMAAVGVAVRPKPELVARRAECPGLVRLATGLPDHPSSTVPRAS